MAYYQVLAASDYREHFPTQLIEHVRGERLVDTSVCYELPVIEEGDCSYRTKESFTSKPSDTRLPARLASPLIPYPQELRDLSSDLYQGDRDAIHGHHYCQIKSLHSAYMILTSKGIVPGGDVFFDMDRLKAFARQSYSHREDLINLATLSFAKRSTEHDLSIAAAARVPFDVSTSNISKYTSFVIMIQRLRIHIAKEQNIATLNTYIHQTSCEEAEYVMFDNGVYMYRSTRPGYSYCILSCGGHFRMYHEQLGYWFAGPSTYLDYMFTLSDILNNLDVLKNCDEYRWAARMFQLLIEFAEHEGYHREQVDFMKSLEGFLLNMSDYDSSFAMNWKPILEALYELWTLDQTISSVTYDFGLLICLLAGEKFAHPRTSHLCKIISAAKLLSRTHLQELSALHKLIFYAEVNAEAGLRKFLKRVHTPREMEDHAVRNITRLAKQLFLLSYRKKHKMLPHIIGPVHKVKFLETCGRRSAAQQIDTLPLSWWDDIKIFDCMDNTLTDDPLEFAKDKGALKNHISYGPGDSRKELLQVIERDDYNLKEFFQSRTITPLKQHVRHTCQMKTAVPMGDPARLIEKEKEQKYEARLFANAELENKHSLSLVAARMKKALSYFDEQLMTPTDKKRKALIHEASRELMQPDNYSLLLDIEGHNQSMQYRNTHELCEFIGNLFGHDGWGQLGHYFSQLEVYHYDEYLDKVTVSNGQLGGIEGWLNPLWTLHTTLMMKLLRIMTDIDVRRIMVYSDDVNAVLHIGQASEAMVQSVFSKVMKHCSKFGMTVKYSQTTLSKHRITMLRQHYADGVRADSTLKRLISVSAANNPMLVSEELEVSGISSSASSAMELSNHHEACSYLKNYKLGLLLSRLPQMILCKLNDDSMISSNELPEKLSNLLYYSKDDMASVNPTADQGLLMSVKNDIAAYLGRNKNHMSTDLLRSALAGVYGTSVAESRLVDSPDRILYLQVYDPFLQDLLFFWTYLPCNLGGLGASLHLNLMLSGHSVGFTKSIHYLHQWVNEYSTDPDYFRKYLACTLSIDEANDLNMDESRTVTSTWQNDRRVCPATTSVQQSIKAMVRAHTKNKKILTMFDLAEDRDGLAREYLNIFRTNFHPRIVQFYHENTSVHFVDLLISKIETSSGLLLKVRHITRLRHSLARRTIENIRMAAVTGRTHYCNLIQGADIVEELVSRRCAMFPLIRFIKVEEILYDDKLIEVDTHQAILTIRRCAPTHYRNGIKVYDDPKVGNETLYKGELLDDDRMLGNKEELLAAKLVAVTKWFLTKGNHLSAQEYSLDELDCVKACNLSLSTLTNQTFAELFHYAPTETGGEILHRIPNVRFSTATYIRSEMNLSLKYTAELTQYLITRLGLVDSNINFDYMRMRCLVAAIVRDKYDNLRRLVTKYRLSSMVGIHDVQSITPQRTDYRPRDGFGCYGNIRGHTLSKMRFRYLSHSYLNEENVNEWALMPKITEVETAEVIGTNYVNDLILRYARDLDRDYMLLSPTLIEQDIWTPLIDKLNKIDKTWKKSVGCSDIEEISERLQMVMGQRGRITHIDKSNRVVLALQEKCLDEIADTTPNDIEFHGLVGKYSAVFKNRRHSRRLSMRLAQYQAILHSYDKHRFQLARALILEYIATFHFKVKVAGREIVVDVEESIHEFLSQGLGKLSLMAVNPDLQVRILILGCDYVENVIANHTMEIIGSYRELCNDISLADIILPTDLPSIPNYTTLTRDEEIPNYMTEVEYIAQEIPLSAMATLSHIQPLCRYAHLCSTTGAMPQVFTSPTGSDSLASQIGLLRFLSSESLILPSTKLCDLTAGRGDGKYASDYLGIRSDSYCRSDTFSRVNHHPDLIFKSDYNVFDGSTLKFVTGYQFVHVDISFTGSDHNNILDLVLFLESQNLSYSIRLNSVVCDGYVEGIAESATRYHHKIAYAMNKNFKPYQIYLIGHPSEEFQGWTGPQLKETVAFKALALSYSHLLSPVTHQFRLLEYEPNSASIYLPRGQKLIELISTICDQSIEAEQLYYCNRYMTEIGKGATIEFSHTHLSGEGKKLVEERAGLFEITPFTTYTNLEVSQVGDVSEKARPFHEAHVIAMVNRKTAIWSIPLLACDEELLYFFRTRHPVKEIRGWCNVALGLLQFCRADFLSGHGSLESLHTYLHTNNPTSLSSHQRETFMAIKLLILAAKNDNYTYGVLYCHQLMQIDRSCRKSVGRTLRAYRLLSYIFESVRKMMHRGEICIRAIDAIENDLEVREKKKFRYNRTSVATPRYQQDDLLLEHIISDSIEDLFSNLSSYAAELAAEVSSPEAFIGFDASVVGESLTFDIGLQDHIDAMVARLNLKPSGPLNIIDLGDDEIIEHDDW